MKFAYLVMTELRSLNKNIQNLYNYIINPYNADIFICVQETSQDDYEKIKLFHKNVVHSKIYKKPNPYTYFGPNSNVSITRCDGDMWNRAANLQIYINYHKMAQVIKNVVNNYDYFITMRTDVSILFPFPRKEFFDMIPQDMYSFNTEYSKVWGGSGYCAFIHKSLIQKYLNCYYFVISNKVFKNILLNNFYVPSQKKFSCNQEKFQKICFKLTNMSEPKYIKNTNLYYNATKLDDYTTWSSPKVHPKYNVICKYPNQCSEAYDNLNLWNSGYRWKYQNDCIFLENSNLTINKINLTNFVKKITTVKKNKKKFQENLFKIFLK